MAEFFVFAIIVTAFFVSVAALITLISRWIRAAVIRYFEEHDDQQGPC